MNPFDTSVEELAEAIMPRPTIVLDPPKVDDRELQVRALKATIQVVLTLVRNGLGEWLEEEKIDAEDLDRRWVRTLVDKYGMNEFDEEREITFTIPQREVSCVVRGPIGTDWEDVANDIALQCEVDIEEPTVGSDIDFESWEVDSSTVEYHIND